MPGFRFLRERVIALARASQICHRDLRILLAMRSARLIAAAIVLGAVFQPAAVAITINMEYTDEGDPVPHDENPSWDPAGVILKAHFQAAKQIWEALLPGEGEYSFDFHWDDDLGATTFGQYTPGIDEFIEINPLWNWFADPTPNDSSEFGVPTQTLYSQLASNLQSSHFPATAPPGALEVGYRGAGITNSAALNTLSLSGQMVPTGDTYPAGPADSKNSYDLLSTVVHEIGHALGLSGIEPGNYNILPQHVGGLEGVEVLEGGGGHLAGQGNVPYLMCESCGEKGIRRFPTATDILVIAEDQGISDVKLARVGRISAGAWSNNNAWIGADVPDATQGAYVTQGGTVSLDVDASVKSLTIDNSSTVATLTRALTSAGDVNIVDGTLAVSAGGSLSADKIDGDPASLTTAAGSTVRFNQFTRGSSSATSATFNGSVAIGNGLSNMSPITFASGPIASWTVGQNLTISDLRPTTLNVNNATWAVGGNVVVGSNFGKLDIQAGGTVTIGGNLQVTGTFNGASVVTVAQSTGLNVVGQINVGSAGRVAYTNSNAQAATISIGGGATAILGGPWPIPLYELRSSGGEVTFDGVSIFTIVNTPFNVAGGVGNAASGGKLTFKGTSGASDYQIVNQGGVKGPSLSFGTRAGLGGETRFEGSSRAAIANIRNDAVVDDRGGSGGRTVFVDSSTADFATIDNYGTTILEYRASGSTEFQNSATAGSANITNHPTLAYVNADNTSSAPRTTFLGTSTAGNATITNKGVVPGFQQGGKTFFRENSTAGDATLISHGGGNGAWHGVGVTEFRDNSNAGTATVLLKPGAGRVDFFNNASAGDATVNIETSPPGVYAGQVSFNNSSKAGTAHFTIEPNGYAPLIHFIDSASAEQAEFDLMGSSTGKLLFQGSSTAAQADIDVGSTAVVQFNSASQVGDATFNIRRGGRVELTGGYHPQGLASVTAGNATINLEGALVFNGARGGLIVSGWSGTGNATVTIGGGNAANAQGADVTFDYGAHGENATIIVESGTVPGALGGNLTFGRGANGENVRVVNQQGGFVNVSGNLLHIAKTTFGSYEGAGTILLGGVELETGSRNTDDTVSGPITDRVSVGLNGRITKVGTGTLTLSGVNTFTGLTTVNAGAVVVNGSNVGGAVVNSGATLGGLGSLGGTVSVNAGGTLAPGASPGKITVGGLNLSSGGTLAMELAGTAAGTQYDQVISSGAFSLAGGLNVSLTNGFNPAAGQSFNLFDWGSVSGTFSALTLPTLGSSLTWNTSLLHTTGVLSVVSAGIPGDYNQDNAVDAGDYVVWRKNGASQQDYNTWRANFGQTAGGGAGVGSTAAVPEPGTLLPFMFAAVGWRLRRRRAD
jgi:autotransporter-associated beta strand protein